MTKKETGERFALARSTCIKSASQMDEPVFNVKLQKKQEQ